MDNRLVRLHLHGDLGEGHLGVATVEGAHDTLHTLRVARSHAKRLREIDADKSLMDTLVDGERLRVVKAAEVDEGSVDAMVTDDINRVEGRMRLTDGREDLTGGEEQITFVDIAGSHHAMHSGEV